MYGRGGGGRSERDWVKSRRRDQQQRDVAAKTEREVDYFWQCQDSNKKRDAEKGGPPRKGRIVLGEGAIAGTRTMIQYMVDDTVYGSDLVLRSNGSMCPRGRSSLRRIGGISTT